MKRAAGWLLNGCLVLVCIGYQLLVHFAVVKGQAEPVRLALLWCPLLLLGWWAVARAANKRLWLSILLVAAVGTFLLNHLDRRGLAAAYGIPHAAAYLSLLWFFGRTLRSGREALITRLHRRVHGTLPPPMAAYTRRLTIAWCVFFSGQLLVSALLFGFASLDAWSLFVNLLNFPLLVIMFVAEYLYRITRYREFPQTSIIRAVRAFTEDSPLSKSADAR